MADASVGVGEKYKVRSQTQAPKKRRLLESPFTAIKLVVTMALIIFMSDLIVVLLLKTHPIKSAVTHSLFDSSLLLFLISPALYGLLYRPLQKRMEAQNRSQREIRELSHQVQNAAEEQQRKIALDLHDEFGQSISALKLELESIRKKAEKIDSPLHADCTSVISQVDELHRSIRSLVARLRPSLLDDLGIEPALDWLVRELKKQYRDVTFSLDVLGLKSRPSRDMENTLFRICQEAISNALIHGDPGHIDIKLTASFPDLILTIRDDGVGFDSRPRNKKNTEERMHFGLLGMRERTLAHHGRFSISSSPGEGTTVRVVLPQEFPPELNHADD